jgi:WD40 repeat protein
MKTTVAAALVLALASSLAAQPAPAKLDLGCPGKPPPRLDLHGDPLPDGAIARLGTVRFRHGQIISGLTFSADGRLIIASDFYSGVHVWDAVEGREVRRLFEDDYYCHAIALSPDGRTLAVALGDLSIRLCDPATGQDFALLTKERDRVSYMAFSPDGSLLITGGGRETARLWHVPSRQLVQTIGFAAMVGRVVFSSDGKLLAGDTRNGLFLWDIAQKKVVRQLDNLPGSSFSLRATFAPNRGPMAVWGYNDASVRLFDAEGVKEIRRFDRAGATDVKAPGPWGWVSEIFVQFSPDGKTLAIVREPGRIDLWDVESGKKLRTLADDSYGLACFLAFSPDGGRLASSGSDLWGGDNTIRVWDMKQGTEFSPRAGHGAPISSIAVAPDGSAVATAGQDGVVHLWEPSSGKHLLRLEGQRSRRPQVSYSSDGRRLILGGGWGSDATVRIWDAKSGQVVGRAALSGSDTFWETVSGDGRTAVSVDVKARLVRFHDLATGKIIQVVPDDGHRPLALSPTGDRFVGLEGDLMTVADRKLIAHIDGVYASNASVRFSADGRRLIAAVLNRDSRNWDASDPPPEEVAVFDATEGKELRRFGKRVGKSYAIEAVALSADGKMTATLRNSGEKPGEQLITLWETETGRERGHFLGHRGEARGLAICADGRFVVSGGTDTSALVWDATRPRTHGSAFRREPPADAAARFRDLAGDDAEEAYTAMWALINSPENAVAFIEKEANLFAATHVQKIRGWIKDLDSNKYAERDRAFQELGLILDEAEPHLKKALEKTPSAEVRRRINLLLQSRSAGLTGKELQKYRVIEMLERIASPGATALLKRFAASPDSRLTREAKASLARLQRRSE